MDDRHPAPNISWYDCIAYANWLTERHGLPFTLPSAAEREYAARGDGGRVYPWGSQEPDGTRANYADSRFDRYFPGTEQSLVHRALTTGSRSPLRSARFPPDASTLRPMRSNSATTSAPTAARATIRPVPMIIWDAVRQFPHTQTAAVRTLRRGASQ